MDYLNKNQMGKILKDIENDLINKYLTIKNPKKVSLKLTVDLDTAAKMVNESIGYPGAVLARGLTSFREVDHICFPKVVGCVLVDIDDNIKGYKIKTI